MLEERVGPPKEPRELTSQEQAHRHFAPYVFFEMKDLMSCHIHPPWKLRAPTLKHIQLFFEPLFSAPQRTKPQALHHQEDRFTIDGAKCFNLNHRRGPRLSREKRGIPQLFQPLCSVILRKREAKFCFGAVMN